MSASRRRPYRTIMSTMLSHDYCSHEHIYIPPFGFTHSTHSQDSLHCGIGVVICVATLAQGDDDDDDEHNDAADDAPPRLPADLQGATVWCAVHGMVNGAYSSRKKHAVHGVVGWWWVVRRGA